MTPTRTTQTMPVKLGFTQIYTPNFQTELDNPRQIWTNLDTWRPNSPSLTGNEPKTPRIFLALPIRQPIRQALT